MICFFLIAAKWRWCSFKELVEHALCSEQLSLGSFSPYNSKLTEFYFKQQGLRLNPAKFSTFLVWFLLEGWFAYFNWIKAKGILFGCWGLWTYLEWQNFGVFYLFFGGRLSRCVFCSTNLGPLHFVTAGGMWSIWIIGLLGYLIWKQKVLFRGFTTIISRGNVIFFLEYTEY